MSHLEGKSTVEQSQFFRCPVQSDCARARLKIGRGVRIPVSVQETSIDGFTILVALTHAKKLKLGRTWLLEYDGARFETHPEWFFHAPGGPSQVGLRRLRDVTPIDEPNCWLSAFLPSANRDPSAASGVVYAGFVVVLFLALAMPGLGDRLGTSPRIQAAAEWIFAGLRNEFAGW